MITVNEARAMTEAKRAEKANKFEMAVQQYIDTEVNNAVVREAKNGENEAFVKYNAMMYTNEYRNRVIEVLEANGYTTRPVNRVGFCVEW